MTTEPTEATQAIIEDVESNIRNILKAERGRPTMPLKVVEGEPPAPTPLPTDAIGGMAADAVLRVYEATAQRVEQMGDEVKERIAALDAALKEANDDLQLLADAAEAIRAKGQRVAELIKQASDTSKAIRDLAAGFVDKVSA